MTISLLLYIGPFRHRRHPTSYAYHVRHILHIRTTSVHISISQVVNMTATAVSTPNSALPSFATLSPASSSEAPPRSDLLTLVDRIRHAAANEHNASADSHSQLLNFIDELKLAVETPNETVLRLIYQVCHTHFFHSGTDLCFISLTHAHIYDYQKR